MQSNGGARLPMLMAVVLLIGVKVDAHYYVKPNSCPDDSIFFDRTLDSANNTIIVNSEDECAAACDNDPTCVAYNIEQRDTLRCEVNDKYAGKYGEQMENAANWEYYEKQDDILTYDSCSGIAFPITGAQFEIMDSGAPTRIVALGNERSWSGKDCLDTNVNRWYRTEADWNDAYYVHEYTSEANFVSNTVFKTHTLNPRGVGSNYIVYGRKFWYRWNNVQDILVYDLDQDIVVGNISDVQGFNWFQGPESSSCQYDSGHHGCVDIEVDETGLWLVFGMPNYNCWLVIAKVDTELYRITWHKVFRTRYDDLGNGFIADGIYYGTDHYNNNPTWIRTQINIRNNTMITYRYDWYDGKKWQQPDTIVAQMHYNPRDKKVYSTHRAVHYRFDNLRWQTIEY